MHTLSNKEKELITTFLEDYKSMLNAEGVPFNPRSLTLISQPDIKNAKNFDYVSYCHWFDEISVDITIGNVSTMLEAYLDAPIQSLILADTLGRPLIDKGDRKKIIKALKLLSEVKIERQK